MFDTEKFEELVRRAAVLDDPSVLNKTEMRVTIDLIVGDEKEQWVTMQAKASIIGSFLAGLTPGLAKFDAAMADMAERVKAAKKS